MRKKYHWLAVIFMVLFQAFSPSFLYVNAADNATPQPEVCSGPSSMMSQYFSFQNEMMAVLLGSKINERRFAASMGSGGLFSEHILKLNTVNALDLVASSVWSNTRSLVSAGVTTVILLLLTSVSVVQSNTEGFAILFKDRPIVRDYKTMLDIESELFDIAYFRSKDVDLTRPIDGDLWKNAENVIKKYQDLGLLEKGTVGLDSNASMSDILRDLVRMNASMKHFIVEGGKIGALGLESYRGCMGKSKDSCAAVIKFDSEAITQLRKDYAEIGAFGSCNLYKSFFQNTFSKTTSSSVNAAIQDVKDAHKRLVSALLGNWKAPTKGGRKTTCDNLSYYELAQLRAYFGPDRTCGDVVNLKPSKAGSFSKTKEALNQQLQKTKTLFDNIKTSIGKMVAGLVKNLKKSQNSSEKNQERYRNFSTGSLYNPEFSFDMYDEFADIYATTKQEFIQSQQNAAAADFSSELKKITGLIVQVEAVSDVVGNDNDKNGLKKALRDIVNYQCSS